MGDVPGLTPYTRPLVRLMVATPVFVLLQVPPGAVLNKFVVKYWHSVMLPVMGAIEMTVTDVVDIQPAGDI